MDRRTWLSVALFILMLDLVISKSRGPCHGCGLYNALGRHSRRRAVRENISECHYPCQCPVEELRCNEGVTKVKDGCGCCYMCARQHGDLCNEKELCEPKKGLYCDDNGPNVHRGICKAYVPKPCIVGGTTYADGQQFKPDCSRLCTCQNGNYGCVDLCTQESKKPSTLHCKNPTLIAVKGQCCKEWTCGLEEGSRKKPRQISKHIKTHNEVFYHPSQSLMMRDSVHFNPVTELFTMPTTTKCQIKSTEWSPCSLTCSIGMSVRVSNDNEFCEQRQEIRLCYMRPCGKEIRTLGRKKCTPTTRSDGLQRLVYQDCRSVKEYTLRFCTTCKKTRCCYPKYTKMKKVEFECSGGRRELMDFLWIRKCQCSRNCYSNKVIEF